MTGACRVAALSLLTVMLVADARALCTPTPTTLCLNNQRFKLEVQWKVESGTGAGKAVSVTPDTGYFWFFGSSNIELMVKVLDARPINGRFWVFFGALTNVEYTMTVTDTDTGRVKTYFNPAGRFASVGDTDAFAASGVALPQQWSLPATFQPASATCVGTEESLCLNGGRFRVEVRWKTAQGSGTGKAVALTSDTGYFWFFGSANIELVVKVLDARGINKRFWVFYGALSDVEYEMTVTDTVSGNVKTYKNPSGQLASVGDTNGMLAGTSVTPTLDASRASSARIPVTGGTLSATAADGTVFTLSVPANALFSAQDITMTPVSTIADLPLSGGLAAAVDLAPAGLRLFEFATLTITPPAAVPLANEITFAWRGNGEEFFLYPPSLGTPSTTMKTLHFSGYGIARGTAGDQSAQLQRVPSNSEDALSQRLADILLQQRKANALPSPIVTTEDWLQRVNSELRQYYDNVLAPELEAAKKNCKKAKAIIPKALSWARTVALLGTDESFAAETQYVMSTLVDATENCYNESFDQCVKDNDPAQVTQMLGFLRQLALLGDVSRVDQSKIERCGRFELDFESVIDESQPGAKWRHQVRSTVPLTLSLFSGVTGNAALVYSSVQYTGPGVVPCSESTAGANSVFAVGNLSLDMNVYEGGRSPQPVTSIEYDPGRPQMTWTMLCPLSPPIVLSQARWRTEYYDIHHAGEVLGGGFLATGWEYAGGRILGRKTYQINGPFAVETTIMNLKHTPQ